MRVATGVVVAVLVAAGAGAAEKPAAAGQTYAKQCAGCHAKDGTGVPKMAKTLKEELAELNLVDEPTQKKADADLIRTITEGQNKKMPAFAKKLTAAQIQDLVAYLRDLAKAKPKT